MSDKQKRAMFAEFDALGEDQVRLKFPAYRGFMRDVAIEWLAKVDQADRLRSETSNAETIKLVRRQTEAAEDANRKADTANTIAIAAMVAAIIAIAVSIISLFLKGS